jgi:hypothetical protein
MSTKNKAELNALSTNKSEVAEAKENGFQNFFNTSNTTFFHSFKGISILIEAKAIFTPRSKGEEEAMIDFAGSKKSHYGGASVITNIGYSGGIIIEGSSLYQSEISRIAGELAVEKNNSQSLTKKIKEKEQEIEDLKEKISNLSSN